MNRLLSILTLVLFPLAAASCSGDNVGSSEDAERAYQGLDASIDKAINLGFDGFNAASNANIPTQTGEGTVTGTMTISGQVDQGASDNKTMNLTDALAQYSDDGLITYDTADPLPTISIKLNKIPNGTLDGTMAGTFTMSGELKGPVVLALTFSGAIEPIGTSTTQVQRKPGTTHIVGTAKSDFGTYDVDITR
jgi:hypothetical protein